MIFFVHSPFPAPHVDGFGRLRLRPCLAMDGCSADHLIIDLVPQAGTWQIVHPVAAGANRNPCWTADSTTLVFVSSRGGQTDLYRSAPDGSAQTAILVRPATEGHPSVF